MIGEVLLFDMRRNLSLGVLVHNSCFRLRILFCVACTSRCDFKNLIHCKLFLTLIRRPSEGFLISFSRLFACMFWQLASKFVSHLYMADRQLIDRGDALQNGVANMGIEGANCMLLLFCFFILHRIDVGRGFPICSLVRLNQCFLLVAFNYGRSVELGPVSWKQAVCSLAGLWRRHSNSLKRSRRSSQLLSLLANI